MTEDDPVVTMRDIRAADDCSRGARKFCLERGLDWTDFLKNGIRLSRLKALNDGLADRVVKVVEKRRG